MSWRVSMSSGSSWRFLQSAQYRRTGNPSLLSSSDFFLNFEIDDVILSDDSTSAEEDFDSLVLFGSLRGNVVGLRYYTGVVNNNEMVALQREPNNQYDRNAVKVNNINGEQVGHIKKELAAALSYIMDNKLARVEGVVPHGANNAFTMPVNLNFWGKPENKQAVLDRMKIHGYKLGPLPASSPAFASGPSFKAPGLQAVQMTTEQLKTEFDKMFEDLKEDDKTKMLEPSKAVGTVLLPHQKQALSWMVSRENSNNLPPFWEQRNKFYYNTLTNFAEKEKPESIRGGILADDMGLGKTLSVIALILTNFHNGQPFPTGKSRQLKKESYCGEMYGESVPSQKQSKAAKNKGKNESLMSRKDKMDPCPSDNSSSRPKREQHRKVKYTFSSDSEDGGESIPRKIKASSACSLQDDNQFAMALFGGTPITKKISKKKGTTIPKTLSSGPSDELPRTTLIICPLSVLSNWIDQFEQHVKPDVQLNIYVYYGPERSKDPEVLSKQDVVLTTYTVVTHDYGNKSENPLHKVKWLRVVLDEGHTIRNPNAQQTKATLSIQAERRWVLTGTPIQNSLKDLWSLLSFLKLKPFTEREWWHRTIQRPVTMGDQGGLSRLQSLIKNITLRRTKTSKIKGKPVLELPERKVFIQRIELSDEERHVYNSMRDEGKAIISRYFNEGTVLAHYADVLVVLVRLRQLCCHPHLVSSTLSSVASTGDGTPEELREKLVNKMKIVLSSGSDEECAICLESLNMPVITYCAHVFCKPCICQVIHSEQPNAKCPLCRGNICQEHLVECPEEEPESLLKQEQKWMSSSKINALMYALTEQRNKDPRIKSIIVSQFTNFLSLIETALRESGFIFTRLDGSMTQKKRTEAIQCFQSSDAESPTIMLLSLKAGGVGLNLTAASRLFLMDPAWNPAAEEQCFDRCHRLGQTKEVIITKFVVKDSVEENMLKIQDKKRELAAGAFGTKKPTSNEMKQARIAEIRTLVDL
ncbi:helicase-like transcription factor isoform X1 [Pelobates cultripes]|uniref:Helicase-like transcription factor isoform X1 n=1 Tax=Pelobates cultripes TaxID=61616 RepID=A0AAD1VTM0_PELCU|nr:helicase-like transcription factor isoform X1 [Pelobates cultripes]CAH2246899.1 helicase-like transcription factor isoform X1 [Pelobates cultripes]CAH2246904.1 helicase-like transcription factor isoform X1 [Pelobates cultripes]CAH2246907.1 helicase-like transcription factor isoform X1 [Pelobates cultripes]